MGEAVIGKKKDLDDVLAADYSYCILLIDLIRNITEESFRENLKAILEDTPASVETHPITKRRSDLLTKLKHRLEAHGGQFPCITQDIFQKVVSHHQCQALERLQTCIDDMPSHETTTDKDELDAALFGYMIHYEENKEFVHEIKQFLERNQYYFDVDISKARKTFIQEFETLRIVDDLIISKETMKNKKMQGKMKILRVSYIKNGNKLYTTLCLARHVASQNKHYMFEVIRDFGNFRLRDINVKKCDTALFRVRRVLQTEHCQFTDPQTFEPCEHNCKEYMPECPGLTCKNCGHVHKQINLYNDLKHLPVLLILQKRGRLGDTFPASFNCMDLRICYRDHVSNVTSHISGQGNRIGPGPAYASVHMCI